MKKLFTIIAATATLIPVFTACSDDDNTTPTPPSTENTAGDGLFIINAGNSSAQIDGSLTFIDASGNVQFLGADGNWTQDAFAAKNGRKLGNTPNDAIVHGSKLYIAVTGENTIEVVDRHTLKSTQISTTELMGSDKGKQPRCLAASGAFILVSTFDGYVASIDTTDLTLNWVSKVGSYPEGMAVTGSGIFVANSDYGQGINPSISRLDIYTGAAETDFKDELIKNPTRITEAGGALYILDYGSYDAAWNQVGAGVYKLSNGTVTKAADATIMAVDKTRGLIYTVNAPYTTPATPTTYGVYDINTGKNKTFITGDDIASPAAIAVDPATGDVYITSYKISTDTGFADYFTDGYVNRYTSDGTFVKQYTTGVGPTALVFSYDSIYE